MIDKIIYHRRDDNVILKEDIFITTSVGYRRSKMTTKVCQLCMKWKGGSSNWISLKDLQESYPDELAY